MTIQELVDLFNSSQYKTNSRRPEDKQKDMQRDEDKKVEFLKKHLKVGYVLYEAKMNICEQILLKSMFIEVNDKEIYKPNTPLKYELTILSCLQAYYDFELSKQFLDDFNLLEKNRITELLIKAIGEDYERLLTVLNMMEDDLAYNNSLVPYLETKMEVASIVLDSLIAKNTDITVQENNE